MFDTFLRERGIARETRVTTVLQHHTLVQVCLRRPRFLHSFHVREHSHILGNHWHLRPCWHLFNIHVFPASFLCKGTEAPECRSPPGLCSSTGRVSWTAPADRATLGADSTQMKPGPTSGLAEAAHSSGKTQCPSIDAFKMDGLSKRKSVVY